VPAIFYAATIDDRAADADLHANFHDGCDRFRRDSRRSATRNKKFGASGALSDALRRAASSLRERAEGGVRMLSQQVVNWVFQAVS
jgi:hypothetical protein